MSKLLKFSEKSPLEITINGENYAVKKPTTKMVFYANCLDKGSIPFGYNRDMIEKYLLRCLRLSSKKSALEK